MSDVLVIRTHDIEKARAFFVRMGFDFVEEQHGRGPRHYACERNGMVLELYPVRADRLETAEWFES